LLPNDFAEEVSAGLLSGIEACNLVLRIGGGVRTGKEG